MRIGDPRHVVAYETDSYCGRCAKNIRTARLEARCWPCAKGNMSASFIWGIAFGLVIHTIVMEVMP